MRISDWLIECEACDDSVEWVIEQEQMGTTTMKNLYNKLMRSKISDKNLWLNWLWREITDINAYNVGAFQDYSLRADLAVLTRLCSNEIETGGYNNKSHAKVAMNMIHDAIKNSFSTDMAMANKARGKTINRFIVKSIAQEELKGHNAYFFAVLGLLWGADIDLQLLNMGVDLETYHKECAAERENFLSWKNLEPWYRKFQTKYKHKELP